MSVANDKKFILGDHNYGKTGVKILHLVRNGLVHTVKELEVSTRLTLSTQKDYLEGDNSDIVDTDSQKNIIYVLAKKYGIKSPEDFGILVCNHLLSTYDHVIKAFVSVQEVIWSRVNYGDECNAKLNPLHNHAFIHEPVCTRFASIVLKKHENYPIVMSGIRNFRFLKTTKSSFKNFMNNKYCTFADVDDRIFSTIFDCSWTYRSNPKIDYDEAWELVKSCILQNFAGDLEIGKQSISVQNTMYITENDIMEKIPEIDSIEMTLPNIQYVNVDFSKFKSIVQDDGETVYLPVDKPSSTVYAKLERNS